MVYRKGARQEQRYDDGDYLAHRPESDRLDLLRFEGPFTRVVIFLKTPVKTRLDRFQARIPIVRGEIVLEK